MPGETGNQSFWDHLDVLRTVLMKMVASTLLFGIVAFLFKDQLFAIVFAPKEPGFITYRLMARLAEYFNVTEPAPFSVDLINTGLAQQFIIHMKTALCAGVICGAPYMLFQLFCFVSPALYENERKYAVKIAGSGYVMFMVGVLVSYFMIFPLTFRFLGSYQVSVDVVNMIDLESYMSTMIMMCLTMGLVFEMPVVCWLLGKFGLLSDTFMRKYRRHALVLILVVAAIITPTSDVFTLALISLPMYLLYEVSILLVRHPKLKNEDINAATAV